MSKTDEKKLESLTSRTVNLMNSQNRLEKTFSRLKNETEEFLRKLMKRNEYKG